MKLVLLYLLHIVILFSIGAIAVPRQFYGESSLDTILSNVQCTGSEDKLLNCSLILNSSCLPQQRDAGVVCQSNATENASCSDGDIRLSNGTNVLEGRVEICINSAWGTVCDTTFSEDEASIICSQTGYRYNGNNYYSY